MSFDPQDPYNMTGRFFDGVMRATNGLSSAPRAQVRHVAPNGQLYPADYSFVNCPQPGVRLSASVPSTGWTMALAEEQPVQQVFIHQAPAPVPVVSQQATFVPGLGWVTVPLVAAPAPPIRFANTYGSSVTSIAEVHFAGPYVAGTNMIYFGP